MVEKRGSASGISPWPVTILAHFLAIAAVTLMLVWIFHYNGGVSFKSHHVKKALNAHVLFMVTGFVICGGEAILAYKTVPGTRKMKKFFHIYAFALGGLRLGCFGSLCNFQIPQGLGFKRYAQLAFLVGNWHLLPLCFTGKSWHIFFGVAIFLMTVCTAETGISKLAFPGTKLGRDALLANFTGAAILLFGIAAAFGVVLP